MWLRANTSYHVPFDTIRLVHVTDQGLPYVHGPILKAPYRHVCWQALETGCQTSSTHWTSVLLKHSAPSNACMLTSPMNGFPCHLVSRFVAMAHHDISRRFGPRSMQAASRQAKGTVPLNLWQHTSTHYRGGPVMSMSTPTHGDI